MNEAAQKHLFYTDLAKMLGAGFGIRQAADAILASSPPPAQRRWLLGLQSGLDAGRSIAESLGDGASGISGLERSLLSAGERSGRFPAICGYLSGYFGLTASARRILLRGLAYPAVLLHIGILLAFVPSALMRGDSLATIALPLAGTFAALYATIAALVAIGATLAKAAPRHAGIDEFLSRIPWLGKARVNLALARFTRAYHACLMAGMGMRETLSTAAAAAHSGRILKASEALSPVLAEGSPLGPAFLQRPEFPAAFSRSYATAELSGTLDTDLGRWADLFQTEAELRVRALAAAVPKILYAIMISFVAWRIIAFYQDRLEILDSIGGES